ncbi:MAG: radical SAM protein [Bacteriovoracia bacterium]
MTTTAKNFSASQLEPWLLLEITTECNLRCKHCHLWRTKEGPAALATEHKLQVLEEFRDWKKSGKVVFTGGEVFLKPREVLSLARRSRELGLHSTALSNATLITDSLEEVLESGLSQLSISLDAPTAGAYDFTRGVEGTFATAVGNIRRLVERRKALGSSVVITLNTILTRSLLPSLQSHIEFARGLGVDGIFFFPLEATFANAGPSDPFYEKEKLLPDSATADAFDFLLAYQESKGFVGNPREDLLFVRENIFAGTAANCVAGERNIIVDLNGHVRFCHLMEQHISGGKSLGNIRDASLRELCTSSASTGFREIMRACQEPCASLNCNRPTVQ